MLPGALEAATNNGELEVDLLQPMDFRQRLDDQACQAPLGHHLQVVRCCELAASTHTATRTPARCFEPKY